MSVIAATSAWIEGIGLRGPGLAGWPASVDIIAGRAPHVAAPTLLVPPAALPAAERRRVGKGVKVALDVAFAAASHAGRDPSTLASIFASSSGDGDNCDAICRELAGDRLISPTRFHNSVHNAPSGYWGIASESMEPSTSLCAFDHSFVAGLDDAMTQLVNGCEAILLVAYDAPYPEPLNAARPTPDSFGVALVLTREPGPHPLARIDFEAMSSTSTGAETPMADPALEAFRVAIPAARALPLLAAVATARTQPDRDVILAGANGTLLRLRVRVATDATASPAERQPACA